MPASPSSVLTLGYGSFGDVALLPTLGYGVAVPVVPASPDVPLEDAFGGWERVRDWQYKRKPEQVRPKIGVEVDAEPLSLSLLLLQGDIYTTTRVKKDPLSMASLSSRNGSARGGAQATGEAICSPGLVWRRKHFTRLAGIERLIIACGVDPDPEIVSAVHQLFRDYATGDIL